jgi:hypothetical protein
MVATEPGQWVWPSVETSLIGKMLISRGQKRQQKYPNLHYNPITFGIIFHFRETKKSQ